MPDTKIDYEMSVPKTFQTISIFSKHLHWLNWERMVKEVKRMGFDGIDLTVRTGGHIEPERVEDDLPRVYEICRRADLKIEMICTDIHDVCEPHTEKILKTASDLGIINYRLGWYFYDMKHDLHSNLCSIKNKLIDIADINRQYEIKGSYQNHDGSNWFGAPVWDLGNILREIDSKWLGCQYDILNATIEASKSWELGFELVAPYIFTAVAKDAFWNWENGNQNLSYVSLGEGMVNFKQFVILLNKNNINVPFTLHLEYDLGGAESGSDSLRAPASFILSSIEKDLNTFRKIIKSENA